MMTDYTSRKLTWKDYLVVASLLFGLFFGAGNLIFPLHLGQLAGANWGTAAVGFLITGVLLPLLSVLAVAITHADGVYDIGKPLGAGFAVVFMVLSMLQLDLYLVLQEQPLFHLQWEWHHLFLRTCKEQPY